MPGDIREWTPASLPGVTTESRGRLRLWVGRDEEVQKVMGLSVDVGALGRI